MIIACCGKGESLVWERCSRLLCNVSARLPTIEGISDMDVNASESRPGNEQGFQIRPGQSFCAFDRAGNHL